MSENFEQTTCKRLNQPSNDKRLSKIKFEVKYIYGYGSSESELISDF